MRRNEMQSLMNKIMERITETRDAGQKEYARDVDNVFANLRKIWNSLLIPLLKNFYL